MQITVPTKCFLCGAPYAFKTYGSREFPQVTCEACSGTLTLVDGDHPLTERLYMRASEEFSKPDWTVSIIFHALACESLIAALNRKWTFLPHHIPSEITAEMTADSSENFRRLYTIKRKLDDTTRLMVGSTIDEFELPPSVPFGPRAYADIYESVFEKRNTILHQGFIDSTEASAKACRNDAVHLLAVLQHMDRRRADALESLLRPKAE